MQVKSNAQNGRILPYIKLKRKGIRFILEGVEEGMIASNSVEPQKCTFKLNILYSLSIETFCSLK